MLAVHGVVQVTSSIAKKSGNLWLIDLILQDCQSKELGNNTDIRVDSYEGVMWIGSGPDAETETSKWVTALSAGTLVELKFALLESKEFSLSNGTKGYRHKIRLYHNNLYTIPL